MMCQLSFAFAAGLAVGALWTRALYSRSLGRLERAVAKLHDERLT